MKSKIAIALLFLIPVMLMSFALPNSIDDCFISFKGVSELKAEKSDKLPDEIEKFRTLPTEDGDVTVTRVEGYRILYNNKKNVPFVNLKVELSKDGAYEDDKKKILDNLKYLNSHSSEMESSQLIELSLNGFKIWGLSRNSIERGRTLGSFVMFPGNGISIYFDFNNLKPEYRNFKDVEDYKSQRNQFIGDYTQYIAACNK